jgi:hypothetical protein
MKVREAGTGWKWFPRWLAKLLYVDYGICAPIGLHRFGGWDAETRSYCVCLDCGRRQAVTSHNPNF